MNREIDSPDLMDMKDTDKYARQVGSKALIMTDSREVTDYEERRQKLLAERKKQEGVESRVELLEIKFDGMLDILKRIERKLDNGNS